MKKTDFHMEYWIVRFIQRCTGVGTKISTKFLTNIIWPIDFY